MLRRALGKSAMLRRSCGVWVRHAIVHRGAGRGCLATGIVRVLVRVGRAIATWSSLLWGSLGSGPVVRAQGLLAGRHGSISRCVPLDLLLLEACAAVLQVLLRGLGFR